ncbi:hypothetical protein RchiOBHm_Chr7g0214461 [Rosa chinensis]|uniref:Uncharacterized protein n=1 Tax=Rosa chinensis TaxID=74649 RepID=A0A2P6PB93_ROSCH|nr:hypothetical protein RchiOBHm_Chr7g0214461 [Rosa chinensis]
MYVCENVYDYQMIHLQDRQKLEGVLSPSHLEDMEFAQSLGRTE